MRGQTMNTSRFQIANDEVITGWIIGHYGNGYDRVYIVEDASGHHYHIHQSFMMPDEKDYS